MLLVGDGCYETSVLGAVNYGRDCDSIATMAGAIAGALSGVPAVPPPGRTGSRRPAAWTCAPRPLRWPR